MVYIYSTRFFDVVTDVSPAEFVGHSSFSSSCCLALHLQLFSFWDFSLGAFFFDIIKSNFSIAFIGCFLVDFWFILGNFSLSRNIEQLLLWVPPYICVCLWVCVLLSLSLHNCTNWLHFGGGARGGTNWAQCGQAQAFPSFPCHLMSFQMLPAPSLSLSLSLPLTAPAALSLCRKGQWIVCVASGLMTANCAAQLSHFAALQLAKYEAHLPSIQISRASYNVYKVSLPICCQLCVCSDASCCVHLSAAVSECFACGPLPLPPWPLFPFVDGSTAVWCFFASLFFFFFSLVARPTSNQI